MTAALPSPGADSPRQPSRSPSRGREESGSPGVGWLGPLLAVGGGWAWSQCFEAEPRTLLPWFALAPLVALALSTRASPPSAGQSRRRLLRALLANPLMSAWLFGLVYWLASMPWIATTISTFGGIPEAASAAIFGLLAAYLGLEAVVFVGLARRWLRAGLSELHLLWLLPAAWVLLEAQRGFFVSGFPWNLASYAWVGVVGALPTAAWLGATGLSFLVVSANVGVALALVRRRFVAGGLTVVAVALVVVLGGRFSFAGGESPSRVHGGEGARTAGTVALDVRVIQPNSPIVWDEASLRQNYERLLHLSDEACDRPALLVWPESAAWPHSWERSARLRADVAALARRGCPVLLGSPLQRPRTGGGPSARSESGPATLNAAFVVDRDGPGPAYAKRRLVPWGEYVPFAETFPFIGKLARNAGDFTPGDDVALLPWEGERLGAAICYEVIFPVPVVEQVRAGASVLVTITNDAWYGDSSAPWQHLRAAQFRAAETRRPLLRAALTGVSATIDQRGRVAAFLGIGEEGILRTRVRGSAEITPFARAPRAPLWISGLLVAFAIIRLRLRTS